MNKIKLSVIEFDLHNGYILSAEYYPVSNDNKNGYMIRMWLNEKDIQFRDLIRDYEFVPSTPKDIECHIELIVSSMNKKNILNKYYKRYDTYIKYIEDGFDNDDKKIKQNGGNLIERIEKR